MPDLARLQSALSDALLGKGEAPELAQVLGAAGLARFSIHRNNRRLGLVDCLTTRFPACRAFVGDEFWGGVARAYIKAHPPSAACLNDYGAGVGDFLETFAPVRGLPYLADLARLEWLIHSVQEGAVPKVVQLASLYPVYDLWRAANGKIAPEAVDPDAGGQVILVQDDAGEVTLTLLKDC